MCVYVDAYVKKKKFDYAITVSKKYPQVKKLELKGTSP